MVKHGLLAVSLTLIVSSMIFAESVSRTEKFSIPAGTTLHCRLTQTLTTKLNYQGDPFTATVSEPVVLNGRDVIPVGTKIEGRISYLSRPGRIHGVGEMRLNAEKISFADGRTYPLSAVLLSAYGAEDTKVVGGEGLVKGPNSRKESITEVAAGMGGGSLVGLLFAHPVVGMTVGGAVGFVDRMRRGGKDLALPIGTQLNYQLTRDLISGH
ncbi:MAG TPA: hypothetical protein VFD30_07110 [Terriglobia bacterium]|nr:hypothetical protein [Terriglobia bacterium]